MHRCWLLTWTTYGTWLPGDERGFVSNVRDRDGSVKRFNKPGTKPQSRLRGLQISALRNRAPAVLLSPEHVQPLLEQFQETARYRGWQLLAVAIMANHVHLVVRVAGDPEPYQLLQSFKGYASRRLNSLAGKPASGTCWTEGGSVRKKATPQTVDAAIAYVMRQPSPLLTWQSS